MKNPPSADVLVIGAGIIGVTCAWRLAQAGARVTVLERSAPGSGASQAALGVLTFHRSTEMAPPLQELCRLSRDLFPPLLRELADLTGAEIDYRSAGQLVIGLSDDDQAHLDALYDLNARDDVGLERASPEECRLLEPGLSRGTRSALFFPEDASVDNTALTLAIARAAEMAGAEIRRANVDALESERGRATGVRAGGSVFPAGSIVLAAGCWSSLIDGIPRLPVVPVRGQALSVEGDLVRRVVLSPRAYLVPKAGGQTMLGATVERAGYDPSNTLGGISAVASDCQEIVPRLGETRFLGAWAGLRPGTPDKMPFIGAFDELPNLFAATGHFRNGILLAPITANLILDLVMADGQSSSLEDFSPNRAITRLSKGEVEAW